MTTTVTNPDRRALLWAGTSLGLCSLALPGPLHAVMQDKSKYTGKPFGQLFKPTAGGFGMIGPWGEVRAARLDEGLTPYLIQTANKAGLFDYTGRMPFVSLQGSTGEIRLTPEGIVFGKAKPAPWDKAGVTALKNALKRDRKAMQSAMQMRSAMATSFAAIAVATKTPPAKQVASGFFSVVEDLGRAATCTTTTVTESVTTLVERTVDKIQTAAQRYAECYDEALTSGACGFTASFNLDAGKLCAAGYCLGKGFIDVVVGVLTIVTEVVEEVIREVTTCTKPLAYLLPSNWDLPDVRLPDLPIKELKLLAKDVTKALEFIREFSDDLFAFLGPFGKCLVEGKWTINSAPIPFIQGIGIPFGATVCITAACARDLAAQNLVGEASAAWGGALAALAALSPEFAAAAGPLGVVAAPALAAATAALSPGVIAALLAILCFIIMALLYASAIAAQLGTFLLTSQIPGLPNVFADGEVCITHPTLALAAIMYATAGGVPAQLVPPIVLG
ncbi:MAG: hypothetical protein HEQ22_02040 [Sphingopyxis sp.]